MSHKQGSKARIAIFGWSQSVHVGRWAKGLTGRGYKVKVISPGFGEIEGVDTVCFPRSDWSYIRHASAAAAAAREFEPDIIHAHYAGAVGTWALRAKLKPLVVSVWGADVMDLPRNPLYRILVKRNLKHATAITATSKLLSDVTVRLLPSTQGRISVIPFGVEIPSVDPVPPPPAPVRICYLKMHEHKYGPDILLKAVAIVKQRVSNVQLNMAGEGSLTESLKKMIADLGLQENVHLLGFLKNTGIYEFIASHHFMVMPSMLDSESFGVAVLEAAACRRPTIAFRVGGVPEVLVDGRTGILLDRGDVDGLAAAIIRLAEDADLRNQMGNAAHDYVTKNYTWDGSLDMMTDLYERLLHGQKQKSA